MRSLAIYTLENAALVIIIGIMWVALFAALINAGGWSPGGNTVDALIAGACLFTFVVVPWLDGRLEL